MFLTWIFVPLIVLRWALGGEEAYTSTSPPVEARPQIPYYTSRNNTNTNNNNNNNNNNNKVGMAYHRVAETGQRVKEDHGGERWETPTGN